ncbi:MAG: sugar kinase [Saprospiraceae bacterium]|nr:sugar kinase [Saprospiraceae bacterium]MCB9344987.1 sugar kinase [Lewinellaceae bacterium]
MATVVTFGEIMMRLTAPGHQRFAQANGLDITYGGGEANAAAALAQMGVSAAHVTVFPENDLGKSAAAFFHKSGIDSSHFVFQDGRLGLYFMEVGAGIRPSRIVYDRYESAFAKLNPAAFNWDEIFRDARWFHWTGITPAVSASAAEACSDAVKTAKKLGVSISADVNYRRVLWQYGKKASEVMPDLVADCDVIVCTVGDAEDIFSIRSSDFESMATQMMDRFPNLKKIIATRRDTLSANHNRLTGLCFDGKQMIESPTFDLKPIVDRIGGGDAFMAGFIYGSLKYEDTNKALSFATAASALKHTIEGDFNVVSAAEVEQVMEGDVSGRLLR